MKKIFYILLAIIAFPIVATSQTTKAAQAGDIYKIWTYPVVYYYDQQTTWYFDCIGTTFAPNEDLYIWIWSPTEPDMGNWENSSEFAKLTYVKDMIWRFDITPTTYFSQTPEQIAASPGFWFKLKDKTGTKETSVSKVDYIPFSTFDGSGDPFRFYPEAFFLDKPLSILFDSKLYPCFSDATTIHMHAGLNDWDIKQEYQVWLPEIVTKTQLTPMGNGIFRMDLIPGEYFSAPEGYVMAKMNFLFVKDEWACTTPDFLMYAPDVPIPPDPVISFFPLKFSVKDLLVITREFNTPGQNLNYTITGGTTSITGDFAGNMAKKTAYINLKGAFGTMDLDKLSVVIKDQNANVLFEGDLSLVQKD